MKKVIYTYWFVAIVAVILISGCKKNESSSYSIVQNNISINDISQWNKWYSSVMPNAPKLQIDKAQITIFKNHFYVRVPMIGSDGMMYFVKNSSLDVKFIRSVSTATASNSSFTGYVEAIDFTDIDNTKIFYSEGKIKSITYQSYKKIFNTQHNPPSSNANTIQTTWLSQFFYCLATYIFAVPARDENGDWNYCLVLGDGNSPDVQSMQQDPGLSSGDLGYLTGLGFPDPNLAPVWGPYYGNGYYDPVQINGQVYTINNYPGLNNGYSWKWWEDATFLSNYGGTSFGSWAIDYLSQNPNVDFSVFQNQFMNLSEGQDGNFDATYWDDPSLVIPQQNLPNWNEFKGAFPLNTDPLYKTPALMYNSIGGELTTFYNNNKDVDGNLNTCAIRLSKALNYSGVIIPNLPGKTKHGADGKYYFKNSKDMNIWMRKTFGTNPATSSTPFNANHLHINSTDAGPHGINLPTLLNGKQGIYSLVSSDQTWATGHCDLLNSNATCGNNCHFYDAPIDYIDIWILP